MSAAQWYLSTIGSCRLHSPATPAEGRRTYWCRKKQYIANIDEHAQIIRTCAMGRFDVTLVKAGGGFFRDIKGYVEQSFKLGGSLSDIDNNGIRTRDRYWANFGVGPSGGDNSVESRHAFGAWRLRDGYSVTEIPVEIVVGRDTKPNRRAGEYVRLHDSIGAYERSNPQFVPFDHPLWCAEYVQEREIPVEKVRDTHRLACLGLPEDKIHLWPCPDP